MKVKDIKAIEILDSRGNPTVRTYLTLDDGTIASASVPSGASTGVHEAMELRDKDPKRYDGQGVLNAVNNVNGEIKKAIRGTEADVKSVDEAMISMDATPNKSKLGANAILSVSMALARAISLSSKVPLWKFLSDYYFDGKSGVPKIMFNVVNGGKHAGWNFDIQEFIIIPQKQLASEAVKMGVEIYHAIQKNLKDKGLSRLVGDEGGFSPQLNSNEEVFQLIVESASRIGYRNGQDFWLGIDAAASEFYSQGKYILKKDNREVTGQELVDYYLKLEEKYLVHTFEDVFDQDDWENWSLFMSKVNPHNIVIGDDLYCTDTKRMKTGHEKNSSNAVLIKLNQIGTVTETAAAIKLAQEYGWAVAVSHRSGETEDPFIADLAYSSGADFLKTGAPTRSDRVSKHNRLIEIENKL
ncbi:MAG: phosphopyruvate hydratase [Patescibacteria group bacterium]